MDNKALLIIDVQVGMLPNENPVYNGGKLLNSLKELIFRARATNTPIFYIQLNDPVGEPLEYGASGQKIHPEHSSSGLEKIGLKLHLSKKRRIWKIKGELYRCITIYIFEEMIL